MAVTRSSPGSGSSNIIPAGSDYYIVDQPRPWVVALFHGETGNGKTTIVTDYCPQPVHIINFDGRAEPVVSKARSKGRNVLLAHIPCPVGASKPETAKVKEISQSAVDRITRNFEISIREAERGNVRTIALDTGTEYSEIVHLSLTGQFKAVKDYGVSKDSLNLIWRRMFIDIRKTPVHFVILSRTKEVWSGGEPTGSYIPRGPSVMEEGVDFTALVRKMKGKKRGDPPRFELVMTNPKLDVAEMGEVYRLDGENGWGEMGPFAYAAIRQGVDPVNLLD